MKHQNGFLLASLSFFFPIMAGATCEINPYKDISRQLVQQNIKIMLQRQRSSSMGQYVGERLIKNDSPGWHKKYEAQREALKKVLDGIYPHQKREDAADHKKNREALIGQRTGASQAEIETWQGYSAKVGRANVAMLAYEEWTEYKEKLLREQIKSVAKGAVDSPASETSAILQLAIFDEEENFLINIQAKLSEANMAVLQSCAAAKSEDNSKNSTSMPSDPPKAENSAAKGNSAQ